MLPSNGVLYSGVLIPKLLSNPFASCSFTNLDFLILHSTHYDRIIVLHLFCAIHNKLAWSVL